jgi:hypothetical protein
VINEGKLAVIMGVEISRLFDCRIYNGVPECSRESVRRDLDSLHREGVRSMEIAVKTDTALSGAAGDPGRNGIVTNAANKNETGRYFDMRTCTGEPHAHDKPQLTVGPGSRAGGQSRTAHRPRRPDADLSAAPALQHRRPERDRARPDRADDEQGHDHRPRPHEPGRARQRARHHRDRRYSGVVSSHSWSTSVDEPRIMRLGGVVTPKTSAIGVNSTSDWFVGEYRRLRAMRDPRFVFGFGIGSDMNGIAKQPIPRPDQTTNQPVKYPFKSYDGKQTIGRRRPGAHLGLQQGRRRAVRPLPRLARGGAPARRSDVRRGHAPRLGGVPADVGARGGRPAKRTLPARSRFGRRGLYKVGLGVTAEALLRRAGQPHVRGPRTWRYDLQRRDGRPAGQIAMVLSEQGRSAYVSSTGPEHEAAGIGPGDRATKRLLAATRPLGGRDLRVRTAGGGSTLPLRDPARPGRLGRGGEGRGGEDAGGGAHAGAAQQGGKPEARGRRKAPLLA